MWVSQSGYPRCRLVAIMTMGVIFVASNTHLMYQHRVLLDRGTPDDIRRSLILLRGTSSPKASDAGHKDAEYSKSGSSGIKLTRSGENESEAFLDHQKAASDRELDKLRERFNEELEQFSPLSVGQPTVTEAKGLQRSLSLETAKVPTAGLVDLAPASSSTTNSSSTTFSARQLGFAVVPPLDKILNITKVELVATFDQKEEAEVTVAFRPVFSEMIMSDRPYSIGLARQCWNPSRTHCDMGQVQGSQARYIRLRQLGCRVLEQ